MPELPEVETVVRQLRGVLPGETFEDFRLYRKLIMPEVTSGGLRRALRGRTVESVARRGKYILIAAAVGPTLVVHLGMTGKLCWESLNETRPSHLRWKAVFESGNVLSLDDIRCFSRVFLLPDEHPDLSVPLGPEPLGKNCDLRYLCRTIRPSRKNVKSLLLDQRVICGLGNIYTNEALFTAGIHPSRRGHDLEEEDFSSLITAIKQTLESAIERSGTTISDFRDLYGQPGRNQDHLLVYGKEGEPCPRCLSPIQRTTQEGRGSFFCPNCQR